MQLWIEWYRCVLELRPACSRTRTFLWMCLVLVGFSIRRDLLGVTSFVRALHLRPEWYPRLLHLFHSSALKLEKLTELWVHLVLKLFHVLRYQGRVVLVADGLKVPKEGKKMPAVKSLHQESGNNSKPEYIMGHSFQVVGLLARGLLGGLFCVPLASRIHEGLVWCSRHRPTLLEKLVGLFLPIARVLESSAILLADAYYGNRSVILPLLKAGHDLVTQVKGSSVAYLPAPRTPKRKAGRPKLYGKKVRLKDLWKRHSEFSSAKSPVYGESTLQIRYFSVDLLWRPVGRLVRFVLVDHPTRGRIVLLSTLLSLTPLEVIELYGYRFKIEVSFKQAIHTLGTYAYHFWMMAMKPITRGSGNQHLHHKSKDYREMVKAKLAAYHRYVQLGCIAQGLLQYLSATFGAHVWSHFTGWLRTMDTKRSPSEMVVGQALNSSLPEFLVTMHGKHDLEKSIAENADPSQFPELSLSA